MGKSSLTLTHREYLAVAIPFMVSTVTQPLLGAVDTAVIGMMGDAPAIAGVSLGTNLFNTLYWLFGFLRVSTTGHSAQVRGTGDDGEKKRTFFLPLFSALLISAAFLVFQEPIIRGYLWMTGPEAAVAGDVQGYFRILVWGAPFVMSNYVMLGWLMGQSRVKASLFMQISGNIVNMALDYWFVCILGKGITGVAAATLISQVYTCSCGVLCMYRYGKVGTVNIRGLWDRRGVRGMVQENRDLLFRTICLVIHNNVFAALGARLGTDILAVNAILLQITSIQAYLFEGLANGSSVFAGRAVGQRSQSLFREILKKTWQWGWLAAAAMSGACLVLGSRMFMVFTDIPHILELARKYGIYCLLYPPVAAAGLAVYGVYTGSSVTRPIFLSTLWSLLLCLPVCWLGVYAWGNDGLWIGYLTFYGGRSLGLAAYRHSLWMKVCSRSLPGTHLCG